MLNLDELKQFAAFAQLGTLSKVAEAFHISTPSVTRAMQRVETEFGVAVFARGKNRIELNETGRIAAQQAEKLLQEAESAVRQVRAFDQRRHTIVVKSCAPAPLWELLRKLSVEQPEKMISSSIGSNDEALSALKEGDCDMAILSFPIEGAEVCMRERLFVCVPESHELARHESLTFTQINGFNFLLRSELGFWDTLCREKMPASKFLVQTDEDVFNELVNASSLPCFTTDYYTDRARRYPGRVHIPLTDSEADVTFYLKRKACLSS